MSDSENIHLLFDMLNNSNLQLELEENFEDGRLNSSFNEEVVLNYIKQIIEENEYDFEKAPAREWYDFKFNGTPFNLKISNMSGADNVSSKKGLVYALTGKLPNNTHQNCLDLLESGFVDSDEYDYGFLIVDKNTKKLYVTSIKNLDVRYLVSNGNNLPFQCNWSENYKFTNRTVEEQSKYLMEIYFQSWLKKLNGFEPLMKWKDENK